MSPGPPASDDAPSAAERLDDVPHGRTWWVMAAIGSLVMAYGAYGLVANLDPAARMRWAIWFLGALLVHDVVLAPLYVVGGGLLARRLPAPTRAPLQAALLVSAAVLFATLPTVLGFGRRAQPGNASILPYDNYGLRLAAVLGVVWAAAVLLSAWRWWSTGLRARSRPEATQPPPR